MEHRVLGHLRDPRSALLLLLTLPSRVIQAGMLDPYIYTGYIHHYSDLLQRYGRTYYSTRVAFLFPDIVFVQLLGDEWGYFAFRYLALIVGAASLYDIARRYYSTMLAIVIVTLFLYSPWTIRSVTYDHYDGFAVIYLLCALNCILIAHRGSLFGSLLAGAFFALAFNCNIFVLAIGGLFFPSWLILRAMRGWR